MTLMLRHRVRALVAIALACLACQALAQELRDPTQAPVEASTPPGATDKPVPSPAVAVLVQDGKPYLVVGTRLVAVGQKVGNARLERITETEIWLREGKQLTKQSRFTGIQRSVAKPPAPCKAQPAQAGARTKSASTSTKPAVAPAAPCEGVQP
jgi:hypothetical protein